MATRIYLVKLNEGKERLVNATSQWQAIRHCVQNSVKAKAATPTEVADCMTKGITLETASTTKETQGEQPTAQA